MQPVHLFLTERMKILSKLCNNRDSSQSIPNALKVAETVHKPLQTLSCRDVGVVIHLAFSTSEHNTGFHTERQYNNSNYYIPNSHDNRLLKLTIGGFPVQYSKKFLKEKKEHCKINCSIFIK